MVVIIICHHTNYGKCPPHVNYPPVVDKAKDVFIKATCPKLFKIFRINTVVVSRRCTASLDLNFYSTLYNLYKAVGILYYILLQNFYSTKDPRNNSA